VPNPIFFKLEIQRKRYINFLGLKFYTSKELGIFVKN